MVKRKPQYVKIKEYIIQNIEDENIMKMNKLKVNMLYVNFLVLPE